MKTPAMYAEMHVLLVFMAIAGIVGLLGGAVLIVRPNWFVTLGKYANRWISTRGFERALERSIDFDRWFYRYSRAGGSLMLLGACWIIIYFTVFFEKAKVASYLSPNNTAALLEMGRWLEGFVFLALAGAVFAAVVSLFLLLRPSLLRDFERRVNRWISTRRVIRSLELRHEEIDNLVMRYNLILGIILMIAALFTLGVLTYWLR